MASREHNIHMCTRAWRKRRTPIPFSTASFLSLHGIPLSQDRFHLNCSDWKGRRGKITLRWLCCHALFLISQLLIMKFSFVAFLAVFAVQNWVRACVYEKRQEWLILMSAWIFLIWQQSITSEEWQMRAKMLNYKQLEQSRVHLM